MINGPGIERLRAAPGAEALRQNTIAVQAKAREEAAAKIAAVKPKAKSKPKAAKAATQRISDNLIVKVLDASNPFKKGSGSHRRAQYVLNADGKSVAAAKRGGDGCFVKALLDRKHIKLVVTK